MKKNKLNYWELFIETYMWALLLGGIITAINLFLLKVPIKQVASLFGIY